jgi:PKD repeat protein
LVIWNCGFDYAPYGSTLTSNDRTALRSFVDAGGKLWLMGPLVLYDYYGAANKTGLPSGDFFRAALGVGGLKRHAGTPDPIKGAAGTLFASQSWDVSTAFGGGSDYGQNVTPTDTAYQALSGPTTDMWGGKWTNVTSAIARSSGSNRTLFFAFEFGQVAGATDRKSCVEKAIGWFDILPHGKIDLSGAQREGTKLDFSASVLDPRASERYEYAWDFSYDGSAFASEALGARVSHTYANNGDFTVALQVKEGRTGLTSPLVTRSLPIVNVAPEAHINTSSPGKEGLPVNFWGNATDGGSLDTFTWEWDFDYDGTTFTVDSTSQNATYTYVDDGTFTCALRVTDSDGAASVINTSAVVVANLPPSGDIFTQGVSDEGENVPFTASVKDPGRADVISVEWDFEYDGKNFHATGAGTKVNHTYVDDGVFTVLMRLTDDDGGVADVTLQVTVRNLPPTGSFITSSPISEGGIIDVNSSVTDPGIRDVFTYEWDFDYDGLVFTPTASTTNSSRQYLQDGTYTVALRVRDGDGGELFLTKDVTVVNVAPQAILEGPSAGNPPKEGSPAQFNAKQIDPGLQDTFTYLWDFGDGTNATAKSPLHTFWDNGTYTVTLRVTDEAGAFGTATLDVIVANVAPNATIAITPMTLLENQTVSCQAEGRDPSPKDQAALTFTWNFGDGQFSNDRDAVHRYLDDGNYTVTLTVSDGFDLTTYQRYVVVENVPPRVVAAADRDHISEGESVNFTAEVTDPGPLDTFTVHWDFGDGATSGAASVSHRFLQDGHYVVLLTVTDDDGGSNATTFLVSAANVRPAVTATSTATEIDEGQSVSFSGSWSDPGTLDTFTVWWEFGDGTNSTSPEVTHAFDENGTYTVVFTVTDETGASSSEFFVVSVANVVPTVAIVVSPLSREIDEGGSVALTGVATDPGRFDVVSFRWDLGDGTPAVTTQSVSHRYLDNKAYRVVLTVEDDDGGRNSTTITITVNNVPPVVTATVDRTETTMGRVVAFNASATDVSPVDDISYSWSFGDGATSTLPSPTHNYQVDGRYEVMLIVSDDDGGQTVWTTNVTVLPDLDGDGIPDAKDPDIDGDGVRNADDDFPRDPSKTKDWTSTYLMLLLIVVVIVAVVAYMLSGSRRRRRGDR